MTLEIFKEIRSIIELDSKKDKDSFRAVESFIADSEVFDETDKQSVTRDFWEDFKKVKHHSFFESEYLKNSADMSELKAAIEKSVDSYKSLPSANKVLWNPILTRIIQGNLDKGTLRLTMKQLLSSARVSFAAVFSKLPNPQKEQMYSIFDFIHYVYMREFEYEAKAAAKKASNEKVVPVFWKDINFKLEKRSKEGRRDQIKLLTNYRMKRFDVFSNELGKLILVSLIVLILAYIIWRIVKN